MTLAAKAHLRNERPIVLAVSTNDALAGNAPSIGTLLTRRHYYFVPFSQDNAARSRAPWSRTSIFCPRPSPPPSKAVSFSPFWLNQSAKPKYIRHSAGVKRAQRHAVHGLCMNPVMPEEPPQQLSQRPVLAPAPGEDWILQIPLLPLQPCEAFAAAG